MKWVDPSTAPGKIHISSADGGEDSYFTLNLSPIVHLFASKWKTSNWPVCNGLRRISLVIFLLWRTIVCFYIPHSRQLLQWCLCIAKAIGLHQRFQLSLLQTFSNHSLNSHPTPTDALQVSHSLFSTDVPMFWSLFHIVGVDYGRGLI